jgi:hypothetical protein
MRRSQLNLKRHCKIHNLNTGNDPVGILPNSKNRNFLLDLNL